MSENFDALAAARRPEAAGVDAEQAEARAGTISTAMRSGGLAAKADLAALEARMTVRFAGPTIAQAAPIAAPPKFL